MNIPYTAEDLDALVGACVEFTDEHDPYFTTSNITGRRGVSVDSDRVRRMMDWVSETDKGILEYTGIGLHNIPYFRLGHAGKQVAGQGFRRYFRRRKIITFGEHVRLWTPIFISALALSVSVLAWRVPQNAKKLDELTAQVTSLKDDQHQIRGRLAAVQSNLDALEQSLKTKVNKSAKPGKSTP